MKYLILLFVLVVGLTKAQHVNNVHLMGHTAYMISLFQELVTELEERGWSSLKVPIIRSAVNETILDRHFYGTVIYSNGFLASMQRVDILQRGIDQMWSWNNTDSTGTVRLTGTLRMLDLALGYDVLADLQDGRHQYTTTVTYPESHFVFDMLQFTREHGACNCAEISRAHNKYMIRINVHTFDVTITVAPRVVTTATIRTLKFLPFDDTADVLTSMFDFRVPQEGIINWGEQVLVPIAYDVYHNKLELPRICYDCPLSAT